MKALGGYFELELNQGQEYHNGAIKLNLARKAFEYVLKAKNLSKVYIPYYTCDVMLEPFSKINMPYEFYPIDENLEPVFNFFKLKDSEYFLYTNYFGLKDKFIGHLTGKNKNIIIDNAQAFFSKPLPGVDTLYSARKFFGVSDGAYLYTDAISDEKLETDDSSDRFGHLIGRIEKSAETSYKQFIENDNSLCGQPIRQMSKITHLILQSINYAHIAQARQRNFQYLHERLIGKNQFNLDFNSECVPLVYPFLSKKEGLREYLILNKVYVPRYWPNVLKWCDSSSLEYKLASNMIFLPIDQRIDENNLNYMLRLITST
jgi:hypothetical protein